MSWRVEHADALVLLGELPDHWAQMCIARPPAAVTPDRALAILTEAQRVLRDDGTLWLLLPPGDRQLLTGLRAQGCRAQTTPSWARRHGRSGPAGRTLAVFLFSKQDRYFYDERAVSAQLRVSLPCPRPGCGSSRRRSQRCALALERERRLGLVRRCVIAGSSRIACGVCGAPYRRPRPAERSQNIVCPTCQHKNPDGRCLIIDPFYEPSLPTAAAVLCRGRSFLGIQDTPCAEQAR
jgi:hypothetical protein